MNAFKRLASRHPIVFFLLGLGFVVDILFVAITGSLRRDVSYAAGSDEVITYSTFAAGSMLAVVYFLGVSYIFRFTLVRRRFHLGLAWLAIIVMFLGWFVIQTALQNGQYKPSFLFVLCLVAAFKTMRFQDESQAEDSRGLAYDAVSSPLDPEMSSLPEPSKESVVVTAATTNDLLESSTPSKTGNSTVVQKKSDANQSKKNGQLTLKTTLAALAAFGCLLALFEMPEDYYKVLRFVVVAACVAVILDIQRSSASEKKKTVISVLFGLIAVIFIPILPLEMSRPAWTWLDVGVVGSLIYSVWPEKKRIVFGVVITLSFALLFSEMMKQEEERNQEIALDQHWKNMVAANRAEADARRIALEQKKEAEKEFFLDAPAKPGCISNRDASNALNALNSFKGIESSDPSQAIDDSLRRDDQRALLIRWEKENHTSTTSSMFGFGVDFDRKMEITAVPQRS